MPPRRRTPDRGASRVPDGLTTGVQALDDLLDGVRVGDNLVLSTRGGADAGMLVQRFVASRGNRQLVVCSQGDRWPPDSGTLVDWSSLKDLDEARQAVSEADLAVGGDALFVFDDLTAIQGAWGAEAALDLFLWACPRLYRRRSVALWVLDADHHRPAFLRRLTAVTQVVVDVTARGGLLTLAVVKADGRPTSTIGRQVSLQASSLETVEVRDTHPATLGSLIRHERTERNLAQAELARRVGITPSALSQLERGARSVSADTITRIWEVLGVPFGPGADHPVGHRISRRSAQPPQARAAGLGRRQLSSYAETGELWRVTIEPHASGRGAPFPVKSPEVITVLRGVVDLELGGHPETFHEGDTLTTTTTAITGWSNPGATECELLWFVLPQRDGR